MGCAQQVVIQRALDVHPCVQMYEEAGDFEDALVTFKDLLVDFQAATDGEGEGDSTICFDLLCTLPEAKVWPTIQYRLCNRQL